MSFAASVTPTPISGVAPAAVRETTVMTVWPSNAKYWLGRKLGTLYAITWPDIYIFRLGNLIALASIPVALVLFFLRILPGVGTRYRLTNRRILVERVVGSRNRNHVDDDAHPLSRADGVGLAQPARVVGAIGEEDDNRPSRSPTRQRRCGHGGVPDGRSNLCRRSQQHLRLPDRVFHLPEVCRRRHRHRACHSRHRREEPRRRLSCRRHRIRR